MKSTRIIFLAGLILAILLGGYFVFYKSIPNKQPFTLKVGIATWPGFAPGYIGQEKGFFKDLNVEFYIIDDFTARQTAFASGKTQATIGTIDSYAFDQGNNIDGKMIMILDQSNGADGIIVKNTINSIEELKGKRIAFTRGSPSHFFLIQILKKHGLSIDSIKAVTVDDPGKAGEAFLSGDVDAAVTWEPNISQITQTGKGKLLESTKTTPWLIVDEMEISKDLYVNHKKEIKSFIDGWLKSVDYIKSNQNEAYSIMSKKINIPLADFSKMVQGISFADDKINKEWLFPQNTSKANILFDEASNVWYKEKLIPSPKKSTEVITSEFINQ